MHNIVLKAECVGKMEESYMETSSCQIWPNEHWSTLYQIMRSLILLQAAILPLTSISWHFLTYLGTISVSFLFPEGHYNLSHFFSICNILAYLPLSKEWPRLHSTTQNGLKGHFIMGKAICLSVKGQIVKRVTLNGVVFIPEHFICCMSHQRILRQGSEMRFQTQSVFFFPQVKWAEENLTLVLVKAADKEWIWVLNTRKWMFSWNKKWWFLTRGLSKWERSLRFISCSANLLWV